MRWPGWRAVTSRPARSSRPSRRLPWCRKPSATRRRSRPRAPRWRSPSRPRRSGRWPSSKKKCWPIRSIIRRASIWRWRINAKGKRAEAAHQLLAIVKRDRKWNEDGARKQLVQFFEAWGATDPATVRKAARSCRRFCFRRPPKAVSKDARC